jgi:hypothetical protein
MAKFPSRPADALGATQFLASLGAKDSGTRDAAIVQEALRGNIPEFMRNMVPITVIEGANTLVYSVCPDYLCLGNDQDYIRVPLGAQGAQQIADAFDCMLPTAKMSNQIWKAAAAKLPPKPMSGRTSEIGGQSYSASQFVKSKMTDTDSFVEHNRLIQEQLAGHKPGELVAGHKKDVVISNELADRPGKVAIHGLHNTKGQAIQGGSWGHDIAYRDYSHGIRLVDKVATLNGKPVPLANMMQNPKYASLISDEGPLKLLAYNYKPEVNKPTGNQQVATNTKPVANKGLFQQLEEYLGQISKLI